MSEALLKKIDTWSKRVPRTEMDMPLFVLNRRGGQFAISANQAKGRLQRPASRVAKQFIIDESKQPRRPALDLVLLRAKRRLAATPDEKKDATVLASRSGISLSRVDIVRELENDTELGMQLRRGYERYLHRLRNRYNAS